MSFRARLTTFFVLIVVIPMAAVGFLVFRLIDDSQAGKADARAAGVAATAASVYQTASRQASLDARTVARDLALVPRTHLRARARTLARRTGIARLRVQVGHGRPIDLGDSTAIAPGIAVVRASGRRAQRSITLSELTAAQYGRQLAAQNTQVVIRQGARTLGATLPAAADVTLPPGRRSVTVGGHRYRVVTHSFAGFGPSRVQVSVLSNVAAAGGSAGADRLLAIVFIAGFLILAGFFTVLSSRALSSQLSRFLDAARRLGAGDFSAEIDTSGRDEFAALGHEFNSMSRQLQRRLTELEQQRARVLASIRRIGEAFASGLDRDALLELALQTAMDASEAERGRLVARSSPEEPLVEIGRAGDLDGLDEPIAEAERLATAHDGVGQVSAGDVHLASVALGAIVPGGPTHGIITVSRGARRFTTDDLELLRSLASRATLALANVNTHIDIQRQAVTDDLTGLASHGHFQELLEAEMHEAARYDYPVGLVMIDLDNFKSINDSHGHQQGDVVLRRVADALRETSRDVDVAARYGGEEMALILPHTDLAGTYETAERVRSAIERLEIPRLDGEGTLRITASLGAAASSSAGRRNDLIAAADGALYIAKRSGKNRTVRADGSRANELADAANSIRGE